MEHLKELSKKNPHWISKHRQLELQHFCLEYKEFILQYNALNSLKAATVIDASVQNNSINDPTASIVERMEDYSNKVKMISDSAYGVDPVIGRYIFLGVTNGFSYDKLNAIYDIPCCKEYYYKKWREFFWRLSIARN